MRILPMTSKSKPTSDVEKTSEVKNAKQIKIFTQEDCPLCADVVGEVDRLKQHYENVEFDIVVLSDKTEKTFKESDVENVPTLVFFDKFVEKQRIIGKPLNLKEQLDIWSE